ncbi:hypothetical protein [Acinetobacter sp.]|uniref:hypothetical protein n=1 Tax=Acinetobacter sp. TaxID=472 RepID=UPI00388E1C98
MKIQSRPAPIEERQLTADDVKTIMMDTIKRFYLSLDEPAIIVGLLSGLYALKKIGAWCMAHDSVNRVIEIDLQLNGETTKSKIVFNY